MVMAKSTVPRITRFKIVDTRGEWPNSQLEGRSRA
jgi:hypothetical protein